MVSMMAMLPLLHRLGLILYSTFALVALIPEQPSPEPLVPLDFRFLP
jgi:hypothetical protein